MGDHEGSLQVEYDVVTMKTKLVLTRFVSTFGTLGFDEKSFFKTLLGFTTYWDFTPTKANHADSPGNFTSDKILYLSTTDKIRSKCDVIDGSVVNGIREPIRFSFVLN